MPAQVIHTSALPWSGLCAVTSYGLQPGTRRGSPGSGTVQALFSLCAPRDSPKPRLPALRFHHCWVRWQL